MLGIILQILLGIGYLLLILLGVILALLLVILFWPLRYSVSCEKYEELIKVRAYVSWLFGLFKLKFEYPTPGNLRIKLLAWDIYESGKNKKDSAIADESKTSSKDKISESDKTPDKNNIQTSTKIKAVEETSDNDAEQTTDTETDTETAIKATKTTADSSSQPKSKGFQKIIYTIRSFCDKIKKILKDIDYYKELMLEDNTKLLFSQLLKRLTIILKSIRPRRMIGEIIVGTGSPDTTGYIMAVYGILITICGKNFIVTPDFENKILEGHLKIKGRLIIAVLAFHILMAVLDRKLHIFLKKFKREEK